MNELLIQVDQKLQEAPEEIRSLILGNDLTDETLALAATYNLSVSEEVALRNTIICVLLGIIKPNDIKQELQKEIHLSDEELEKLVHDLDISIFQKARIKLFGEDYEKGHEIKKITLGTEEKTEALRTVLLDNTKRTSAIESSPVTEDTPLVTQAKQEPVGTRSALLEQLTVLQNIPTGSEVEARLQNIQAEIKTQVVTQKEIKETKEKQIEEAIQKTNANVPRKDFPTSYERTKDPYREDVV